MRVPLSGLLLCGALLLSHGSLIRAQSLTEVDASRVGIHAPGQRIEFSAEGGLPSRWLSCVPDCDSPGGQRLELLGGADGNTIRWIATDPVLQEELRRARYQLSMDPAGVELRSVEPVGGRLRVHQYRWDSGAGYLRATFDLPAGAGLQLAGGRSFIPESLPGFGAFYGDVRPVQVNADGQTELDELEAPSQAVPAGAWSGLRNRFWTLLARAAVPVEASTRVLAVNQPMLTLQLAGDRPVQVDFYGGPVERARLRQADPVLGNMQFAALWNWLRGLCIGMLWLLAGIQSAIGSPGLAIILLSLAVKILMFPLTRIADRWQAEVNRTEALLQPALAEIRRHYKGEEAHNRVLAVYKAHNVHPLYTLRSLAGFLIQIPIFIAAFDMLGENFALSGASFLWIDDLAKPDRFAALPLVLPFFGGHLNLLPFLMTGFTVLASSLQADPALTDALRRQQRLRLILMAAAFFVLFYTFPAGMVLYWTTNNVLHLVKMLWGRLGPAG